MLLYNSLSGQKEQFIPLQKNSVSLYVCGVTVYDFCHIGHARTYSTFDTLVRYLRWSGFNVNYVRNITDIDDKIIQRAAEKAISVDALVKENIQNMYEDFDALNLLRPDQEPRATTTIPEMLALIQTLLAQDYAYVGAGGDVYFEVAKFKNYGKLSKQHLEALQSGIRVEVADDKKSPFDFVLWKRAKPDEPAWDSPWGSGRPGWHIECSAMTKQCLGETFDIHGGGTDLRFPHHENEIAQSEAANQGHFANYWMHSGMVQVNNEKMSKSLNNFFVIRDVLKQYPAEVVRYFLMSGHYRSEISYSTENLESAQAAVTRLYTALRGLTLCDYDNALLFQNYRKSFIAAMDDDLNTPEAFAILFSIAREINRLKAENPANKIAAQLGSLLTECAGILGLLQENPEHFLAGTLAPDMLKQIQTLIAERECARQNKNFQESDRIRDLLKTQGIELEDAKGETIWRKISP